MKKSVSILLSVIMLLSFTLTGCAAEQTEEQRDSEEIILQIGNPNIIVKGTSSHIDEEGTTPIIVNDRTLLPVRAVVEAMGGTVAWNGDTQTVTLNCGENEIQLIIDNTTAYLNNSATTLDTAPSVINDRTMLPIRFIAESFGYTVEWNEGEQKVTITKNTSDVKPEAPTVSDNNPNEYKIKLTAEGQEFTATLYKNSTTNAIIEKLPLTLPMMDLYDNEMCYRFPDALPTDDAHSQGYEVGEIMYWPPAHSFVIRYAQNGEHFEMQKLGKLDSGLEFFQSCGDVDVKIELIDNSDASISNSENTDIKVNINGTDFTGVLYNNLTAKHIKDNLPLTVSLNRGNTDYCGGIGIEDVKYNDADVSSSYECGDLAYWIPGDDFVVFRTGGTTDGCIIIGKVNADTQTLNSFGNNAEVTVSAK